MSPKLNPEDVMLDRMTFCLYSSLITPLTYGVYSTLRSMITPEHFMPKWLKPRLDESKCHRRNAPVKCTVTRLHYNHFTKAVSLCLTVFVNPTRLLAYDLSNQDYISPKVRSLDGNDNCIRFLWRLSKGKTVHTGCFELLLKVLSEIQFNIENAIRLNQSHEPICRLHWSIQQAELYWDVRHDNAIAAVYASEDAFRSKFKNVQMQSFRRLHHETGVIRSAPCLKGSRRVGELYKLYAKMGDTLRYELRVTKHPIRLLCGSNILNHLSQSTLEGFLSPIVTMLINEWSEILTPADAGKDFNEALSAIYKIALSCSRQPDLFLLILNELMRNGRLVSRRELYVRLSRLFQSGILRRTGRGIYTPSASLLHFLKVLHSAYGNS